MDIQDLQDKAPREGAPKPSCLSCTSMLTLIPELIVADTFWKRSVGLSGRSHLKTGQGLLLRPCGSIHTCFMRFPIDVIFLDDHNQVVKTRQNVAPWRLVWGGRKAHAVIEVQSGWLAPLPRVGDVVDDTRTPLSVDQ